MKSLNTGMRGILLANSAPIVLTPAYGNDFDAIIPDMYNAMHVASRELVGFIPSVMRAPSVERVAVGQEVNYLVEVESSGGDIVPSMTIPEPDDIEVQTNSMKITKSRQRNFGIVGEEQRAIDVSVGPGFNSVQAMWIANALRRLFNEVEQDLAIAAACHASRAYGTAGTTPFGGDKMTDSAQLRKILDDNGAPSGRALVGNTSMGANLRSMYNLTRAQESATTMVLQHGELINLAGFSIKESGQAVSHVKGTAASAATNATGYPVGSKVINLGAAGTGAIKAGDVIQFAGQTHKYMVAVGDDNVANGGSITIANPGLMVAIPAAATAITVLNDYEANVGFSTSAIHLATRAPALPNGKDAATDSYILVDPFTGLAVEFRAYYAYRKARFEVGLAWGTHVSQSEHVALLLG